MDSCISVDSWLAEAAGYGTVDVVPPTETVLAETEIAHLPRRPCLAPGRTVLWRAPDCVQLGLSGPHAMVLDGLTAPMAALLRGMDGSRDIIHLIGEAATAGADPTEALAVITELHRAGLVRDEPAPRYCERTALDIDLAAGSVHSGQSTLELVRVRRSASVLVRGSGRVAVALAVALATAGLGRVVVAAEGTVQASDLGTGYLPSDVGRERADAARDALRRAARGVRTEPAGARSSPDLVVVTDAVVPDPDVALDLVVRRRPHLAVYAQESVAAVGPLVLVPLDISGLLPTGDLFSIPLLLSLPLAIAVAVLRYRLWDLDRLVSRTVTYAAVTALLLIPYLLVLPITTRLAGSSGSLAVAAATLTAAAAFQPLRRRVQALVDRRFNRRRYDAARTLEAFATRLRDQVDLGALHAELLGVVDQTMQPTHASLWLRPPARQLPAGG